MRGEGYYTPQGEVLGQETQTEEKGAVRVENETEAKGLVRMNSNTIAIWVPIFEWDTFSLKEPGAYEGFRYKYILAGGIPVGVTGREQISNEDLSQLFENGEVQKSA